MKLPHLRAEQEPEEDRNVVLITNYEKRMSAYEMYLVYKTRMSEDPKL